MGGNAETERESEEEGGRLRNAAQFQVRLKLKVEMSKSTKFSCSHLIFQTTKKLLKSMSSHNFINVKLAQKNVQFLDI